MRPAQRALARALPKPKPGLRMVQASVVVAASSGTGSVQPGVAVSDSFQRADSDSLGSTDGGTHGPQAWTAFGGGPAFSIVGNAAAVTEALASGSYYASTTHVDCGSEGGTYSVTIASWQRGDNLGLISRGGPSNGHVVFTTTTEGYFLSPPEGAPAATDGYAVDGGAYLAQTPQPGDVMTIVDRADLLGFYVNGAAMQEITSANPNAINGFPLGGYVGAGTWAGMYVGRTHVGSGENPETTAGVLRDFSYTPLAATGPVTTDVEVDFGDGVAVACPRLSNCPALAVGDIVLVLREHHSNVVVDKITPLGDS